MIYAFRNLLTDLPKNNFKLSFIDHVLAYGHRGLDNVSTIQFSSVLYTPTTDCSLPCWTLSYYIFTLVMPFAITVRTVLTWNCSISKIHTE